ncbi:hypothetical protein TSAR_013894 [Trichomalopsis sarcophagae]|uniref:Secreted protein n=1 Tax=Trichomalopsis sarcophagae TaxID=543379 RepID=A0A232FBS9_9HYME|nr:hypothetical protein TSAR_013894 [Trichomalopsis sarcophagae]
MLELAASLSITGPVVGLLLPRLYCAQINVEVVLDLVAPVAESSGKVAKAVTSCPRLQIDVVYGDVATIRA